MVQTGLLYIRMTEKKEPFVEGVGTVPGAEEEPGKHAKPQKIPADGEHENSVCVCVHACVRACVPACVCMRVCVPPNSNYI